jgi:hypothetical protein
MESEIATDLGLFLSVCVSVSVFLSLRVVEIVVEGENMFGNSGEKD